MQRGVLCLASKFVYIHDIVLVACSPLIQQSTVPLTLLERKRLFRHLFLEFLFTSGRFLCLEEYGVLKFITHCALFRTSNVNMFASACSGGSGKDSDQDNDKRLVLSGPLLPYLREQKPQVGMPQIAKRTGMLDLLADLLAKSVQFGLATDSSRPACL
jgi:hypothetical protein